MIRDTDRDFAALAKMKVPVKRAAYSDRTAWIMAILSELAYTPYDEESSQRILDLAATLAQLTDQKEIADRLVALQRVLAGAAPVPGAGEESNRALKAALAAGGFELAGDAPLYDLATDTQGFVACRRDATGTGMAVICFRGTRQIKDWMINIDITPVPVRDETTNAVLGNMHKGFHDAYMSVHDDIAARLSGYEDLPLYITGHSLGGALAVVATWYQSSERLAACYTYGAPRVGDQALIDLFKTPIYRVVNAADPVPLVPPSGFTIEAAKMALRAVGSVFPLWGAINWMVERLIKVQHFRHYGYMRYLTDADPDAAGDYPGMRVEFAVSNTRRLIGFIQRWREGTGRRIDRYHDMSQYRGKLAAYAQRRNRP
jgi:hypothetical protein